LYAFDPNETIAVVTPIHALVFLKEVSVFKVFVSVLFLAGICASSLASEEVGTQEQISTSTEKTQAPATRNHFLDIGTGLGLDYGGIIGINVAYIPIPYLSFFVGTGWELMAFGWNTGIKIHAIPEDSRHVFRINFKIMYGVNGATSVVNADGYDKVFLGFTPGIGFEFMFGSNKSNGFDFDLNFPIHGSDLDNEIKIIRNDGATISDPLPIAISLGYHHEF
jgi:hypothetical protein